MSSTTARQRATVRPPLVRPRRGRVAGGVCLGVSRHLGIPLGLLRAVTALACVVGVGLPAYLFLWLTVPAGDTPPVVPGPSGMPRISGRHVLIAGVVVVVVGAVSGIQAFGSHLSIGSVVPLLAIAGGAVLVWSRLDAGERRAWISGGLAENRQSVVRLAIGAALVVGGIIILVSQGRGLAGLRDVTLAALVLLFGVALIAAPFIARLWDSLRQEQAARIRATEKADIAAHLHDSVLQTLALIQRRSDDPQSVRTLARAQERELRDWLYAQDGPRDATLASLAAQAVREVEERHAVPVELVVTGDRGLGEKERALVAALGEATANAVRHGRPPVSVYLEVAPEAVEAFVRDHGEGFDPDAVPADRLGVRESILGRMSRHGGTARVRRLADGTEVSLRMPLEVSHE